MKKRSDIRPSQMKRAVKRFLRHRLALPCLIVLLLIIAAAVLAPVLSPYSPTKPCGGGFNKPPSPEHLLGTDKAGRDMLTRVLYAARASLLTGALATIISTLLGTVLGLASGYFGGWLDRVLMAVTDMVMSFPTILLVLVAAAVFEPGMWSIIIILGLVDWPGVCRLVRGNVLSLRETAFIRSDVTAGLPARIILFSSLLPNTLAPVLVYASSVFAVTILDEAALSFLGMGIQPPTPSLGNLLNSAQSINVLAGSPWLWIPAGVVIVLLVVCINFIGDALRDALDPKDR